MQGGRQTVRETKRARERERGPVFFFVFSLSFLAAFAIRFVIGIQCCAKHICFSKMTSINSQ